VGVLTLKFEPFQVNVDDPAEAATWGRLTISLGERVLLSKVHDRYTKSTRDGVDGTVLPLAEWLARNWASIFSWVWPPPPRSMRRDWYEWRRSHAWRMAGQGMALPALELWRSDRSAMTLRAVADDDEIARERVAFLQPVEPTSIPLVSVKEALASFVDLVVRRCEESAPDSPRTRELRAAWERATNPADPSRPLARWATRLGLAWAHLSEAQQEGLRSLIASHSEALLNATDVLPWMTLEATERMLHHLRAKLATDEEVDPAMAVLKERLRPSVGSTAWKSGWQDAEAFRNVAGLPRDVPVVVASWTRWRETPAIEGLASDLSDSVVGWLPGRQPIRMLGRPTRFRDARDLWSAYFGGKSDTLTVVALGGRGVFRPVANAFATELLAPIDVVRRHVGSASFVRVERVDEIAEELGAPPNCVRHQIENHGLARIES
jgi:hypothetical protein